RTPRAMTFSDIRRVRREHRCAGPKRPNTASCALPPDRPKRRTVALRASVGSTEATSDQSASVSSDGRAKSYMVDPGECFVSLRLRGQRGGGGSLKPAGGGTGGQP